MTQVNAGADARFITHLMNEFQLLARYPGNTPRYTSFPTAPHFEAAQGGQLYESWLAALPADAPISVYFHVPFCRRLCRFCGCHTSVVHHDAPMLTYTSHMMREIELVAANIPHRVPVSHVHWGGGTPTALPPECIEDLMAQLRTHFNVLPDAEIAFEIDPVTLTADQIATLRKIGLTRASVGLQDLDPKVQQAIGRPQSFEITQKAIDDLRAAGARSINLDLLYGLPFQTEDSVIRTAQGALDLAPDRLSVFGYAHVPWMKKHQNLLPQADLPGSEERFKQRAAIDRSLREAGYVAIGLDHYAKPQDSLAQAMSQGRLRRNFQGYTDDNAESLIGFGASSIGSLPQGYVANITSVPAYSAAIHRGELPIARIRGLLGEDRLRREVIFRIMCDLEADLPAVAARFESDAGLLADAHAALAELAGDGIVEWDGQRVRVTETGRPFMRHVAACFDPYFKQGVARHSSSV